MRSTDLPRSLPPGYGAVWAALRRADEQASSRQSLANDLGVATHTLQRILVEGDVPSFPETGSIRIIHAWVRTLTRIAYHLGHDPRAWIEGVGIEWSETIKYVSDSALRAAMRRARDRPMARLAPGGIDREPKPTRILTVGVVDRPPFSDPLTDRDRSFLEVYAQRLLGAIDHSCELRFEKMCENELINNLASEDSKLDLGIGLLDTVERRALRLDLAPIPGWGIRLSAILIRPASTEQKPPSWRDLTAGRFTNGDLLVLKGGVACSYLSSQCEIASESLHVLDVRADPITLAHSITEEQGRRKRSLVLVDEGDICRRTADLLLQQDGFADRFTIESIKGTAESSPIYRLSVVQRSGEAGWKKLLGAALEDELHGHAIDQTARLYAEQLLNVSYYSEDTDAESARTGSRLIRFDDALSEFKIGCCTHLLEMIQERAMTERQAGVSPPDARTPATARKSAAETAVRLIPESWLSALGAAIERVREAAVEVPVAAGSEPDAPAPLGYCRSCSALLSDGIHGGISDRYCRFCSDENGRLKPRDEVEDLLTLWIQGWQGTLSRDEARRRAVTFMNAMPAWNEN